MASEIREFFFDWYPVFGVVFMAGLLFVFLRLLRAMGSTKPETVKASRTEPVLWEGAGRRRRQGRADGRGRVAA
ncbi:MAG: hypothetical protein U0R26_08625 [Solirubrobacterales bacterium]